MKIGRSSQKSFRHAAERSRLSARGPYKFYNREFIVISYRTDPDALRAVVPRTASK